MRCRTVLIPAVALAMMWPAALPAATPTTEPAADSSNAPATAKQFPLLPATQPATQPSADDAGASDEPKITLDSPSIQSVVKLTMQDRMLSMSTDLPVLEESARIKIADFPGKTTAVVNNQHQVPMITIRHEIDVPPNTMIIYMLSSLQNDVRLAVDSENDKELRSVQFIQSSANEAGDPDDKPVKLYVSVTDVPSNTKLVDLKLQADDVVQLRRKYPRETAEYFQPMLAALGQEEVAFAVDHRTAWQVLHSHFNIDPKIDDQVKKLVEQLDGEDYGARETASDTLEKLGEPAALVVMKLGRGSLSSEQNSRLDAFLAPYKPLNDTEAKQFSTDVPFLLDCLYTDSQSMRQVALEQLRQVTGKPIDLKTEASPTAWRYAIRQLRKELITAPTTQSVSRAPDATNTAATTTQQ